MIHTISGNNFHGDYSVNLRGAADGFILSDKQAKKVSDAMCGMSDCQCGGGYGGGADAVSALVIQSGWDSMELVPVK